MTTNPFLGSLISLVADLSTQLPAEQRYRRLLQVLQQTFPCDACALLRYESPHLVPLAVRGLSEDTLGRRFPVAEHPRLAQILAAPRPVRFAADCALPDPYDGLVESADSQLVVHDCMGAALHIDGQPWGVLTLDALDAGSFDGLDLVQFEAFLGLTAATVKAAELIGLMEQRVRYVSRARIDEGAGHAMIGESECLRNLCREIAAVAPSELAVLILGETGVGKELVAQRIHLESGRADQMMVYVNCAALPEHIAESELFGHTRGAFSGAVGERAGKFELAHRGTLFLDEIGELSLPLQAKLLRTLQNGEIQRVGSDRHIQVDVRILAATNRNLKQEVANGAFRADLYHRLAVYPLPVPPLRERGSDVLLLAGAFLERNQQRLGIKKLRLAQDAKRTLLDYHWPGNIRELEHLLSRAALKASSRETYHAGIVTIRAAHLDIGADLSEPQPVSPAMDAAMAATSAGNFKAAVEEFQRRLILQQLARDHGNRAAAARALGFDRSNFHRLLKRLGIHPTAGGNG